MLSVGFFLYFYNPHPPTGFFFLFLFVLPFSYQTSEPPTSVLSGFGVLSYKLRRPYASRLDRDPPPPE